MSASTSTLSIHSSKKVLLIVRLRRKQTTEVGFVVGGFEYIERQSNLKDRSGALVIRRRHFQFEIVGK